MLSRVALWGGARLRVAQFLANCGTALCGGTEKRPLLPESPRPDVVRSAFSVSWRGESPYRGDAGGPVMGLHGP